MAKQVDLVTNEVNELSGVVLDGTEYKTRQKEATDEAVGILEVFAEPDPLNDAVLRTKSAFVDHEDFPVVSRFMQEKLLPTMYAENGIGIAAIQVGLPIKAFIVDIPITKMKGDDGQYHEISNPRAPKERLEKGEVLLKLESFPIYQDGAVTWQKKLVKYSPKFNYVDGKKVFAGIDFEAVKNEPASPDIITERSPLFIINPKITTFSEQETTLQEGCLSVPVTFIAEKFDGKTKVKRPISLKAEYQNEDGIAKSIDIDGTINDFYLWQSRCFQHEFDHTEGVLFIDRLLGRQQDSLEACIE